MGAIMRGLLVAAAVVAGPLAAGSARRSAADDLSSLAGQLLVAAPKMEDPTFGRSVIFMIAHDDSGALGLIVNEPVKDVSFDELFDLMRESHEGLAGKLTVHFGGPVEPRIGFVLHSRDVMLAQHELPAGDVAVTNDPAMLTAIAEGRGPVHYIVTLGYAGWGPGQLETEIQQGAWLVVPSDPDLLFAPDAKQIWQRAVAKYQPQL